MVVDDTLGEVRRDGLQARSKLADGPGEDHVGYKIR